MEPNQALKRADTPIASNDSVEPIHNLPVNGASPLDSKNTTVKDSAVSSTSSHSNRDDSASLLIDCADQQENTVEVKDRGRVTSQVSSTDTVQKSVSSSRLIKTRRHLDPADLFVNLSTEVLIDAISILFILLHLPPYMALVAFLMHTIASSSRFASSFAPLASPTLIFCSLLALFLFTRTAFIYGNSSHMHLEACRHITNAAAAISAAQLLGPVSIRLVNSLADRKLSSRILYNHCPLRLSAKAITAIVGFATIEYVRWFLAWLCPTCSLPPYARSICMPMPGTIQHGIRRFVTYSASSNSQSSWRWLYAGFKPWNVTWAPLLDRACLWISIHTIVAWVCMRPPKKPSLPDVATLPPDRVSNTNPDSAQIPININESNYVTRKYTRWPVPIHNFLAFVTCPVDAKLASIRLQLRALSFQLLNRRNNMSVSGFNLGGKRGHFETSSTSDSRKNRDKKRSNTGSCANKASAAASAAATTVAACHAKTFSSLTTTTTSAFPRQVTIELVVTLLPLWLYFAAIKAFIWRRSAFGADPPTGPQSSPPVSIVRVTNSTIICRCTLQASLPLSVLVNNLPWPNFRVAQSPEDAIIITTGLKSQTRYEFSVLLGERTLSEFTVRMAPPTTLDKEIAEPSPVIAVRKTINDKLDEYSRLKNQYKKLRRDSHKRIGDLKHTADSLKSKISKYNSQPLSDARKYGKLQGLKHSISQLENEISQLQQELHNYRQRESHDNNATDESTIESKMSVCHDTTALYEERMARYAGELQQLKQEASVTAHKRIKLEARYRAREDEVRAMQSEVKNIKKNAIIARFQKRSRKATENSQQILSRIEHDTQCLRQECSDLLDA